MSDRQQEAGPLTKDFRSSQSLSLMLGTGAVAMWIVLAVLVRSATRDGAVFAPGPGTVLVLAFAMVLTVFSAAAFAVSWVTVVVHRGTVSVRHGVRDALKETED